ncbi:hypothetical protein [Rhodococcus ruber]|uniref:hypothetical protein n=1 Tax=Rhodococcus ruber TaxID=1830 RepID=UPI0037838159
MALADDGTLFLSEDDLRVALDAADPTDAWLLHQDGSTGLDPADDISRFTVPGYWPRYLMRAGSATRTVDEFGDPAAALAHLNTQLRANIGGVR